jgi:excisionase family DNA binding protein
MREVCEPTRTWLTAAEAAGVAGVHRYTVYHWIARGRLRTLPSDDGAFRVAADDLARLLAARRAAAAAGVRLGTILRWTGEGAAEAG